jgi:hypothetical protein
LSIPGREKTWDFSKSAHLEIAKMLDVAKATSFGKVGPHFK